MESTLIEKNMLKPTLIQRLNQIIHLIGSWIVRGICLVMRLLFEPSETDRKIEASRERARRLMNGFH